MAEKPGNSELLKLKAAAYQWLSLRRWDRLEPALKTILAMEPNDAFALWALAEVHIENRDVENAEATVASLLRLNPEHIDAQLQLVRINLLRRDFDAAM